MPLLFTGLIFFLCSIFSLLKFFYFSNYGRFLLQFSHNYFRQLFIFSYFPLSIDILFVLIMYFAGSLPPEHFLILRLLLLTAGIFLLLPVPQEPDSIQPSEAAGVLSHIL